MSTPRPEETRSDACEAADGELVRLLAVFAKATFTYQPNNRRTVEAGAAFSSSLEARAGVTGGVFRLECRTDGLYTATGKVPSEPVRDWLHGSLQRALIGGLHFRGDVSLPELHRFLARLRSNTAGRIRRDATFQGLWPETYAGLELRELRFYGDYSQLDPALDAVALGADGSPDPRAALLRLGLSEVQIQRLVAMERRFEPLQTAGKGEQVLSIPRELVAALPADVLFDPSSRAVFVDRLLDRFEQLIESPDAAPARSPEALNGLVELFRKVPRTFFEANLEPDSHPYVAPSPSLPQRPEEQGEDLENVSTLLLRVQALPEAPVHLEPDEAALQAETLRVCIEHLGAESVPRVAASAAAHVKRFLEQPGAGSRGVLERFVQCALVRDSTRPPAAVLDRALARLEQHGLMHEMRRRGGLTVERLARYFPFAFGPFLKSLDAGSAADGEALAKVLNGIPESSLGPRVKALLQQEEIKNPVLMRKLLAMGNRSALGIARHLLQAKIPQVTEEILADLREYGRLHPEAAPLLYLDASDLPLAYLEDLCEFERPCKLNPRLRAQAGFLLQSFVESTPSERPWIEKKARAITGLGFFPGPASEAVLEQQLRGEGLLGPLRVPKPIRDAVREVQAQWRRTRDV